MPRMLLVLLVVLAVTPVRAATAMADHASWLTSQIDAAHTSQADAAPILELIWRQQQCTQGRTCIERVTRSALAAKAHFRAGRAPPLLALLANTEASTSRVSQQIHRWQELANCDPQNAYPEVVLATLEWQRDGVAAALDALRRALRRSQFNDYYTSMFMTVLLAVQAHPPGLAELAPCTVSGEDVALDIDPTARNIAAVNELLGGLAFPHFGNLITLCRTTDASADHARRALCDSLGARMATQAPTLLSRNIGLALRRFSTEDASIQERYAQAQRNHSDDMQRALWWLSAPASPHRSDATALWLQEFSRAGEFAGAAALHKRYGEPPESRASRQQRWQEGLTEGQACYAKLRQVVIPSAQPGATIR